MSRMVITNAVIVYPDRLAEKQAVMIEQGRFVRIGSMETMEAAGAEVLDAGGSYLAAGFIDLHLHGTGEFLVDAGPEALRGLCRLLPKYGVTGFLPTLCPRPKGQDTEFLRTLAAETYPGCQVLGFHLEGPFLSLTGALPPEAVGIADPRRAEDLIDAARPYRAVFSVSPEFRGLEALWPIFTRQAGPVFLTHTQADVRQTQTAIDRGARHATHFYDVFYSPKESDPGVRPCGAVEAILADPRVSVDFILDGEHVDPAAVRLALRCKGPEKVCLITDANIGAGLPPGRYDFGGSQIEFRYAGGPARLTEKSGYPGGLAGSGLTMDLAVRNARRLLDLDVPTAVRMASESPARVLGLDDRKGRIAVGYDADFVLLNPNLEVRETWISGQKMYPA